MQYMSVTNCFEINHAYTKCSLVPCKRQKTISLFVVFEYLVGSFAVGQEMVTLATCQLAGLERGIITENPQSSGRCALLGSVMHVVCSYRSLLQSTLCNGIAGNPGVFFSIEVK